MIATNDAIQDSVALSVIICCSVDADDIARHLLSILRR